MVPDSCCFQDDAIPSSPIDVDKCNSDVVNGTIANSEYVFKEVSSYATTMLSAEANTNTNSSIEPTMYFWGTSLLYFILSNHIYESL